MNVNHRLRTFTLHYKISKAMLHVFGLEELAGLKVN